MADVTDALDRLARLVDELRAGVSAEADDEVAKHAEVVCRTLLAVLRMTRTHAMNNQAFARPILDLRHALGAIAEAKGAVPISAVENLVYVCDGRVRFPEQNDIARELTREFSRHGLGGLTFHEALNSVQLRLLVECLANRPETDEPIPELTKRFTARGLGSVELMRPLRFKLDTELKRSKRAKSAVRIKRAASLVDQVVDNLGANRMPDPVPLRRLVSEIAANGPQEGLFDERVVGFSP